MNGEQFFTLNPDTGRVIPLLQLNRSVKQSFVISIRVSAVYSDIFQPQKLSIQVYQLDAPSTRFSYSLLVVTVEDTNDHAPEMISPAVMNVTIPEGAGEGYYVTSITAQDLDQVPITQHNTCNNNIPHRTLMPFSFTGFCNLVNCLQSTQTLVTSMLVVTVRSIERCKITTW